MVLRQHGGVGAARGRAGRTAAGVRRTEPAETGSWLRGVGEFEAAPLPGAEGALSLAFSPGGDALAFLARGKLWRIDLAGGPPAPVCDVAPGVGYALRWGARGELLFASVRGEAIERVPVAGGTPRRVVEAGSGDAASRVLWPHFLPDGRGFLYTRRSSDGQLALILVEGDAPPREVGRIESRVELLAPDWLLFAREGALFAQQFDRAGARLVGAAVAVAPRVRYFSSTGWAGFAASTSGTLVYLTGQNVRRLVWFDRSGGELGRVGEPGDYLTLALSPDGRNVLVDRTLPDLGTYDLWRIDLERDVESRLTTDADTQTRAVWLPDGRSVVYSSLVDRAPNLVVRDLASGAERPLLPRARFQLASDVAPDGRRLAYKERAESGRFVAYTLELDGDDPRPRELVPAAVGASDARFAPDGRHVAYLADTTGRNELYVAPLANPLDATRVSRDGARQFRFGRSGREIVYLSARDELVAVPFASSPQLAFGAPTTLFTTPVPASWVDFDLAPDGERILAIVVEQGASGMPASVVVGWRPPGAR
jgi:dipeptidyl aminopeptidase/acylaminoacyl peptidase